VVAAAQLAGWAGRAAPTAQPAISVLNPNACLHCPTAILSQTHALFPLTLQLEWGRGRVFDAEVGAVFQRLVSEAKQVGGRGTSLVLLPRAAALQMPGNTGTCSAVLLRVMHVAPGKVSCPDHFQQHGIRCLLPHRGLESMPPTPHSAAPPCSCGWWT